MKGNPAMQRRPIPRALAKDEIARINASIAKPLLLIGGLAVQQYHTPRDSQDIDLVCDFETAQRIVDQLYSTLNFRIEEKHQDEYRPSFRITSRVDDEIIILFGPKITERENYDFVDWEKIKLGARPFRHLSGQLNNILVPLPHALAFTKLVSFCSRTGSEDKIRQDLADFVNLTNVDDFNVLHFYSILHSSGGDELLSEEFKKRIGQRPEYAKLLEKSCLGYVTKFFGAGIAERESVNRQRLGPASGSPILASVYISAPHRNVGKNDDLANTLRSHGFDVCVPYHDVIAALGFPTGQFENSSAVREVCRVSLDKVSTVIVDLDSYGLDSAWEVGYAEGKGKEIIGYNNDILLTTDKRNINRRPYLENFMHGWADQSEQIIYDSFDKLINDHRENVIYVCGSFGNPNIDLINSQLDRKIKKLIFPKKIVENKEGLPQDYPFSDRDTTIKQLTSCDVLLVALPRYGMDSSWQIGYATALGKRVIGIKLNDDHRTGVVATNWDHWMHGWKQKTSVIGKTKLIALLRGYSEAGLVR